MVSCKPIDVKPKESKVVSHYPSNGTGHKINRDDQYTLQQGWKIAWNPNLPAPQIVSYLARIYVDLKQKQKIRTGNLIPINMSRSAAF